jgi:hypothetical protein
MPLMDSRELVPGGTVWWPTFLPGHQVGTPAPVGRQPHLRRALDIFSSAAFCDHGGGMAASRPCVARLENLEMRLDTERIQ